MNTENLLIQSESGKGRTFRATLLACLTANSLWNAGSKGGYCNHRPVFAVLAGSDAELRAFIMNLRGGRKARRENSNDIYEFPRSSGYDWRWQKHPEGSICTAFLPDLFAIDPGLVNPKEINFVLLPDAAYLSKQQLDSDVAVKHALALGFSEKDDLAALVPEAALFSVMLSRRSRLPWSADIRFFLQLYLACLTEGIAVWPKSHYSHSFAYWGWAIPVEERGDLGKIGYGRPVAMSASHAAFQALLSVEIKKYFEVVR